MVLAIVAIVGLAGIATQFSWNSSGNGATGRAYYLTTSSYPSYSTQMYQTSYFQLNICQDHDGDGYQNPYYPSKCVLTTARDCNDRNKCIYPGATDFCDNGVDEDCDGADTVTAGDELCGVMQSSWAAYRCTHY